MKEPGTRFLLRGLVAPLFDRMGKLFLILDELQTYI